MSGFNIVFDMSSDMYAYQTKLWHDQIRKATKPNSSIVFIGNKSDKEDAIPCSKINTILEHDYFVASARTSQGVDVAFGRLFDMVSGATLVEDTVSEALRNLSRSIVTAQFNLLRLYTYTSTSFRFRSKPFNSIPSNHQYFAHSL